MKRKNRYNPHVLKRIISLDKIRSQKRPYTSPQRRNRNRKKKTPRKRFLKKRNPFLGEWRVSDLSDEILENFLFPFVDVYTVITNLSLVSTRINKLSMKTLNGRQIQDSQTIEFLLYHKPCDDLLHRLVRFSVIDCEYDPRHVFQFAVKYNRASTVRYMIQKDLVDPSSWKNYAIQTASECGHLKVVRQLLRDKRVDPSVRDNYALRSSWYNGHIEIVKCLLKDSKLKIGKDLGYIPDYIEMMKEKGSDIVELMDSEDRNRMKYNEKRGKFKNVIIIKKYPHKNPKQEPKIHPRRKLIEDEKRNIQRLSPIQHRPFKSPVNPKTRRNLESIDIDHPSNRRKHEEEEEGNEEKEEEESQSSSQRRKKRIQVKNDDDEEEEEEEEYDEDDDDGEERDWRGRKKSKVRRKLIDKRLRELENFAKELLFKKHEMSIGDSSFGEAEHFEEIEKLREESGMLKRKILELEKSISEKQDVSDIVLGRVRQAEGKRKAWKNILLTVVVSWILVFLTFLVLDFYFPVQLYYGFFPS